MFRIKYLRAVSSNCRVLIPRHTSKRPVSPAAITCGFSVRYHHNVPDKKLFTPGPLGVSMATKEAMLHDLGSRDVKFINIVHTLREKLVELAGVSAPHFTCVPMQGSGTFSIEATLTTTVPKDGKVLILENGAYGKRQAKICDVLNIPYHMESFPEDQAVNCDTVSRLLSSDIFSHVSLVHCETSSGVINDIVEIGKRIKQANPEIVYFVDAMSSFGAIPLNMETANIDYLVSSANKCIEGVPGFSYAICNTQHLLACKGLSRSYSLDLVDQYENLEKSGQFRFTPPTHAMLAFTHALEQLEQEGGIEGRSKRYQENQKILQEGMRAIGFKEFLDNSHTGYIITSYHFPSHPNFDFNTFYQRLSEKDQVIYPGKVLDADCFRIGNIGHLFPQDMEHLISCIRDVLQGMDVPVPLQ